MVFFETVHKLLSMFATKQSTVLSWIQVDLLSRNFMWADNLYALLTIILSLHIKQRFRMYLHQCVWFCAFLDTKPGIKIIVWDVSCNQMSVLTFVLMYNKVSYMILHECLKTSSLIYMFLSWSCMTAHINIHGSAHISYSENL